jgi:hypothetical protein
MMSSSPFLIAVSNSFRREPGAGQPDAQDGAAPQCQADTWNGHGSDTGQYARRAADRQATFYSGYEIAFLQQARLRQMSLGQGMVIGCRDVDMALLDARQQQFVDNRLRAVDRGYQKIQPSHGLPPRLD